jgi:hypothetical protein
MASRMEKRKSSKLGQGKTRSTKALLNIAELLSLLLYSIREEDGELSEDSSPAAY